MSTWVAFLRAINLGPTHKFPKADVIAATEAAGFDDVATHLNTGNVRVTTAMRSRARIEAALEKAYAERAGFDVPTVAFRSDELAAVLAVADELGHQSTHLVSLLKREPSADDVAVLESSAGSGERIVVRGRAAHLLLPGNQMDSKISNAVVEKHLGQSTNRNLRVIRTVVEKWCS